MTPKAFVIKLAFRVANSGVTARSFDLLAAALRFVRLRHAVPVAVSFVYQHNLQTVRNATSAVKLLSGVLPTDIPRHVQHPHIWACVGEPSWLRLVSANASSRRCRLSAVRLKSFYLYGQFTQ